MANVVGRLICLIIASTIMLASCSTIPITSIPKLMTLDVETIEIGDVEMALRIRDDFQIKDKGAVLKISIENKANMEKSAGKLSELFILERSVKPLTPFLARKQKDGFVVHRFEMTEEAVARATILRENAYKIRAKSSKKNSVTISAFARFCRKPGANPFVDMPITFFIRTNPKKKFYTLFKETKMPIKGGDGKINYCEEVGE